MQEFILKSQTLSLNTSKTNEVKNTVIPLFHPGFLYNHTTSTFVKILFRYYTALERTLFLDHASDAHMKYWELNCKVHKKGIELIKPGAKCSDIAKELNEIYREHDLLKYRSFGYGHSFGSLCHYYGREAGMLLL